jgi:hypothetical protein
VKSRVRNYWKNRIKKIRDRDNEKKNFDRKISFIGIRKIDKIIKNRLRRKRNSLNYYRC